MKSPPAQARLPWLQPGQAFPSVEQAWGERDPVAGLLAGGADLSVATLRSAYSQGIFPWFSAGQPILWWSPNPRMVLQVANFQLHRSLRKALTTFLCSADCEIRIDHDFAAVIRACASAPRQGQTGTWIVPEMQEAYIALHRAGLAHSVEVWVDDNLVGGLYCTALGQAVFGESMFAHQSNASKIALAALVVLCQSQGVVWIDCQQNTSHLASLGAREMPRAIFCSHVACTASQPAINWSARSLEWKLLDARWAPSP